MRTSPVHSGDRRVGIEAGGVRAVSARLRSGVHSSPKSSSAQAGSRHSTTPRYPSLALATKSSSTRRIGRHSRNRSARGCQTCFRAGPHRKTAFAVRAESILAAVTARTRGVIINSPCNPTGALIAEGSWPCSPEKRRAKASGSFLDLCYEKLIYDKVPHNLPAVFDPLLAATWR